MAEFFADFGLRDWLLLLGPVLVLGILIHGFWRMRVNRNSLRMALDKSFVSDLKDAGSDDADELSLLRAELPNGGARVLSPTVQTSLDLDDDVPVLMDVADDEGQTTTESTSDSTNEATTERSSESTEADRGEALREPEAGYADHRGEGVEDESEDPLVPEDGAALPSNLPEKYVVINVMAVGEAFQGQELLECLLEENLAIGEMNIFHYSRGGQQMFSLMNAVEPGSFDMATMDQMTTPALSMFMRVHELHQPVAVFQQMLKVAQNLAEALGGEVRDESRSVMTGQTIEHSRQELEDYVFKYHT